MIPVDHKFKSYSEGRYKAMTVVPSHGLTVVGYKKERGFIGVNSYGRDWGRGGLVDLHE